MHRIAVLRTAGTSLRHLIIFPNRVSQTVVGEHKLEAIVHVPTSNRPTPRQQPNCHFGACECLGKENDPFKVERYKV